MHGPLPSWLSGPFAGAGEVMSRPAFAGFLAAMLACYLVAVACAPVLEAGWVLACAAVLIGLFALAPPLLSKDIFSYIAYARLGPLYHLNPYVFGPVAAAGDHSYRFVGHLWRAVPTVYGPAFTLPSYLAAPLGVGGAMWAFKAAAAASAAGSVGLVWWCARRLGRSPATAVAVVGLNPIMVVYAVGGGHNDLESMLFAVTAIALVVAGRQAFGGAAMIAAAAVKLSGGLALPFMLVGARRRRMVLAGALVAGAALAAISYPVFGAHPLTILHDLRADQALRAGSNVVGYLEPHLGIGTAGPHTLHAETVVFVVAAGAALLLAWRGYDWISAAGWATLALLLTAQWLLPWYLVWLLPLAALGRDRKLLVATLAFTVLLVAMRTTPWLLPAGSWVN
jgi:alpha-1,6-mannosyltransferase